MAASASSRPQDRTISHIPSHPISSERSVPHSAPRRQSGRFWRGDISLRLRDYSPGKYVNIGNDDVFHEECEEDNARAIIGGAAIRGARIEGDENSGGSGGKESREDSENEGLMEEDECRGVGSRRYHKGDLGDLGRDDGEERTFFGTSHFGPQLAAAVIHHRGPRIAPLALSEVRHLPSRSINAIDDTRPYSLTSQIRELVALLPSKERCDRYVEQYFTKYNDHIDILYQPDFVVGYERLWAIISLPTSSSPPPIDLRFLSLLLVVLAFGVLLDARSAAPPDCIGYVDDLPLAAHEKSRLRAIVGALGQGGLKLREREELSFKWSWGARRALVETGGYSGESVDTVRAGAMIALYMIISRRVPEAWTAIGQAVRAAEAQGMHVDGASWEHMSLKECELRRRLWARAFLIASARSVSLFLGRPLAIQDSQYTTLPPLNLRDSELGSPHPIPRPLSHPTKTTFLILHHSLNSVIGQLQMKCFGLRPRTYDDVLSCEDLFDAFQRSLPPHFRLETPDTSLDGLDEYRWLRAQRQTLVSKYHLARIALHRPYLLRSFSKREGARYVKSREACLFSSIADIELRTGLGDDDPLDRFKWMTVASGFYPATIIGILCVWSYRDPRFEPDSLLALLKRYISFEARTVRRDEQLENELKVLRMMVDKAVANQRHERDTGVASASYTADVSRLPQIPQVYVSPKTHLHSATSTSGMSTNPQGLSVSSASQTLYTSPSDFPAVGSSSSTAPAATSNPAAGPGDDTDLGLDLNLDMNLNMGMGMGIDQGFTFPPLWDSTAPSMPESNDMAGWGMLINEMKMEDVSEAVGFGGEWWLGAGDDGVSGPGGEGGVEGTSGRSLGGGDGGRGGEGVLAGPADGAWSGVASNEG